MRSNESGKNYSMFVAPIFSFFSCDLYSAVARDGKGFGGLYMLMVVAIAWGVTSFTMAYSAGQVAANKDLRNMVKQLPGISFDESGRLAVDQPLPYNITDLDGKTVLCSFVKEHKDTQPTDQEAAIIVTPDMMLFKGSDPVELTKLSAAAPQMKFTGAQLNQMLDEAAKTIGLTVFSVGLIPVFLGHLFVQMIYGFIVMMIASGQTQQVNFSTGMRLAAVAMTPSILISALLWGLVPFVSQAAIVISWIWTVVAIVITVPYLILAAKGAKATPLPMGE